MQVLVPGSEQSSAAVSASSLASVLWLFPVSVPSWPQAGWSRRLPAQSGGIVGSLVHTGVSDDEAHVYAEGVRRGGSLVTVRTDEIRAVEVERIMNGRSYVDWRVRNQEYRDTGWVGFDEAAPPYVSPTVPGERVRGL